VAMLILFGMRFNFFLCEGKYVSGNFSVYFHVVCQLYNHVTMFFL
jgi:hypothetical protein